MSSAAAEVNAAGSRDRREGVALTEATIASVVFGDLPVLDLNRRLTERLNPGARVRWRVVRNLPLQDADRTPQDDPGVEVLDGEELPVELRSLGKFASYHHALALDVACRDVPTRYLILIDPDCFVVRPNWIEDVLAYVQDRGLAFFGVPYHPRSMAKFRYFPCSVFLVVDTEQVPVSTLDWRPEAESRPRAGLARRVSDSLFGLLGWEYRLRYELSEDTGIRVYSRYRDSRLPYECVQPVMIGPHLRGYEMSKQKALSPLPWVLEKLLPDRYCMVPKRPGYVTDRRFAEFGFEDTAARPIWAEEFLWRNEPFALHLRKSPESLRKDPAAISRLLDQFA
jgi:hypothetical protein